MRDELRKLARLKRLERVRAIARQTAASQSAAAETRLSQLQGLAARTGDLAADYAARCDAADGGTLRHLTRFRSGLQTVSLRAEADAETAHKTADQRQGELARAERSRTVVADRIQVQVQAIGRRAQAPALAARRAFGTKLD
jgi:hypothetical protein